jgi:hypothetical protein
LVNGEPVGGDFRGGLYAVLRRIWQHGDQVRLEFAPSIDVVEWPAVGGAVSVRRGPLWYALRIGEKWKKYGGTEDWPAYEILPATPWNYGLVLGAGGQGGGIRIGSRQAPPYQPFSPEAAPIVLKAKARRVPSWREDGRMVGLVPTSPAAGEGPVEEIDLIPMGCARLRISSFPVVKD